MTEFQSAVEFNELLGGRTLRFLMIGSESNSGRPLSAAFQDVASGEVISVMAIFGALEANVVPSPARWTRRTRRDNRAASRCSCWQGSDTKRCVAYGDWRLRRAVGQRRNVS